MSDYRLAERVPSVEDYNRVRVAAGLSEKYAEAAMVGLANTVFGVCVENRGEVVGLGRVIGDGGLFFEVVDIAVVPEHQKKGLGKTIMDALMSWLTANAPPTAFVSLIADEGLSGYYERYGFRVRPPEAPGMSLKIGREVQSL
jgi:GNAT superfamily N-acetyltransferase